MANALYNKGREKFLRGEISWNTDTIKAVLVDAADYTVSLTTHEFLSDIPTGGRVATTAALTSKTTTDGVADAADPTFAGASGDQSEYIVLYKDTGSAATSPLIGLIDTATGLPVLPNTGDIAVVFDNGANKIFKL
ncbi:hypothetical protein Psed_5804 [Pseudonocardia dioxanivorans CB1190]|uniref:Bacteriophage protein n=1 Tax=Pseudonocardia dioxanivorans (strain ATCC 55486 / DSM 44775 / JCM 13855 / CB1190) TaxID=675635 RepID=F4D1E3_PSEUX|nr:hypothetical protein [Pseudonocardia dioxanivorans]AEA27931.1 hypothetical protein Psed_5804 [Pseudonocardia dioxanivorans CB1190]